VGTLLRPVQPGLGVSLHLVQTGDFRNLTALVPIIEARTSVWPRTSVIGHAKNVARPHSGDCITMRSPVLTGTRSWTNTGVRIEFLDPR